MDDSWTVPPPKQLTPEEKAKRLKNKVKRGAHVTASQLAEQLNITPRVMRSHLRALKLPKPQHGWAWPPGEAKTIAAKIAKRLKHSPVVKQPEPATVPTVDEPLTIEGPQLEDNLIQLKVA